MKIVSAWERVEKILMSIFFILMVLCVFLQVVNRNITQLSIGWFEELGRYCMIALVMLGAELGLRDGSQMAVTFFSSKLPDKVQKFLNYFTHIVVIAYSAFFSIISWKFVIVAKNSHQITPGLEIEKYIVYLIMPIVYGIITVFQLITFVAKCKSCDLKGTADLEIKDEINGGE